VNLIDNNIDTAKEAETVIDVSEETDLEINVEKTKYMLLSCHQKVGINHDIKIAYRCFKMWHR
jgi:hypothetical protein